jgi:hypothetical protein
MPAAYHIRVLFLALVSNEKARSDRNRSERASMIRLELGTATRAQSGSIHGAEDNQKVQWNHLLPPRFLRLSPLELRKKCQSIGAGRSPWQGHDLTISRQYCGNMTP